MRTLSRFFVALIAVLLCCILYFASQNTQAQTGCATQPASAVAWYPGDGNASDLVRANDGALRGNATYAAGHAGQAFSFDGDTDGVSVGNPEQLRLQTFTIEGWVKRGSAAQATLDSPDAGVIFGYGQNGYAFYVTNYGRLALSKVGVSNVESFSGGAFPELRIADTNFHHVAVVKSGTYATFYLDGVASSRKHYDTQFGFETDAAVGARGDNLRNSLLGSIDELMIYDRALSAAEIQSIHVAGAAGKCKETRLQFEHAVYPAGEASGAFTLAVRRTGDTRGMSVVNYATADGTARAGEDYTPASGTLAFMPGEQAKTISVPVTDDQAAEADETVQITLGEAVGAALGTPSSATLNIFNTVPGAGRITLITGNIYSAGINAYNTDGTNGFQMTSLEYGTHAAQPSVARHTGMIAFQGCGDYSAAADCSRGYRIFVMNGDGTNVRQVTTSDGLDNPYYQADTRPVISPDGTQVAFLSARPPAQLGREEVFVVNTDGTGLRPITTKVRDPNLPGHANESYALSVAWSPDSAKLLVHAFRRDKDDDGNPAIIGSLYTYNPDGTGETLLVRQVSNFLQGSLAIDWSPDGRHILYASKGGPHHEVFGFVIMDAQNPAKYQYLSRSQLTNGGGVAGDAGSARFSPDSQRIVYGAGDDGGNVNIINIDGQNRSTVLKNYYFWGAEKWWWGGQAIPQPARLELTPDPLMIWFAHSEQLTPTLYDAGGNVIFHAAQWEPFFNHSPQSGVQCYPPTFPSLPPGVEPCSGTPVVMTVNQTGIVSGGNRNVLQNGEVNFCASNAGLTDCARIQRYDTATLSVRATTPNASKASGTPGVFTISRFGNPDGGLAVPFSLGGTALREADYFIESSAPLSDDTVLMNPGEDSVTVSVTPVAGPAGAGDKSVVFTLRPASANEYAVNAQANTATVTIRDDAPPTPDPSPSPSTSPTPTPAVELTRITPNRGGDDGSVTATIHGRSIQPGATAKLARDGQADIVGGAVNVASDGRSLTATFDLENKPLGAWSVVVSNPDGTSDTLTDAFTIEEGRGGQVWADVIGRKVIRARRQAQFHLVYGNRGNVDAPGAIIFISVPRSVTLTPGPGFPRALAPAGINVEMPQLLQTDESVVLPFWVRSVPAGSTGIATFQLNSLPGEFDVSVYMVAPPSGGQVDTDDPLRLVQTSNFTASNEPQSDDVLPTLKEDPSATAGVMDVDDSSQVARLNETPSGTSPADEFSSIPMQDLDAVTQAFLLSGDGWRNENFTERVFFNGDECVASAKLRGARLEAATRDPSLKLFKWRVRTITKNGSYGAGHTTNLITSPDGQRHYLVDNYVLPTVVPMELTEDGWTPVWHSFDDLDAIPYLVVDGLITLSFFGRDDDALPFYTEMRDPNEPLRCIISPKISLKRRHRAVESVGSPGTELEFAL